MKPITRSEWIEMLISAALGALLGYFLYLAV